jgi:hypothetical protein
MAKLGLGRAPSALGGFLLLFALSVPAMDGCANEESVRAKKVVGDSFKCPMGELEAGVARETPKVREWIVGCNFVYARIHCSDGRCYRAPPVPPCIGELPCFKEDPVTLEWNLDEKTAKR